MKPKLYVWLVQSDDLGALVQATSAEQAVAVWTASGDRASGATARRATWMPDTPAVVPCEPFVGVWGPPDHVFAGYGMCPDFWETCQRCSRILPEDDFDEDANCEECSDQRRKPDPKDIEAWLVRIAATADLFGNQAPETVTFRGTIGERHNPLRPFRKVEVKVVRGSAAHAEALAMDWLTPDPAAEVSDAF